MNTENILPYLNGEKRMVPKKTDLTYYNWDRGTAAYNSTANFQVVAELPRLLLRHTGSDASLDITTSTPGILYNIIAITQPLPEYAPLIDILVTRIGTSYPKIAKNFQSLYLAEIFALLL